MAQVHAEVVAGREELVLFAAGPADDVKRIARGLQTCTPALKATEPKGGLVCGLTWAAVVQISTQVSRMRDVSWHPGPRLQEWLAAQVINRTAPAGLVYQPPAGRVPYPWQLEGARMVAAVGSALLTDDPGCISGDAMIAVNRNRKGFTLRLADLVARLNGEGTYPGAPWDLSRPTYVQREVDGVVRLGRIVNAWASGLKKTFTVTTETGRTIRATDEHPFLTERGWLRLDELTIGDLVHVRGTKRNNEPRQAKPPYREIAGLYSHPHARGLGRRTSRARVAHHRLVCEAALNNLEFNDYLARVRSGHLEGLQFLDPREMAVHHKDRNPDNNELSNLEVLTHTEHHRKHALEGKARNVLLKIGTERVVSVVPYGVEETFDIEVADDPHNFLADGFVVHNTGKTITSVLAICELIERAGTLGPVLVVCPASVIDPWVRAFADWSPLNAVAWRGTPAQRNQLTGYDVYVASYDMARIDGADTVGRLTKLAPAYVVIDEVHQIKTQGTLRSKAVRRLASKAQHTIALSGTPITHHPGDLWPALNTLEPKAFPSRERWVRRYCETVPGDYKEEVLGLDPANEPEFRLTLQGQMRRVAKADVLEQLPPKVYSVRTVDLPPAWRKAYDQLEHQMLAELPDGEEISVMTALSKLTRLSQLSSAPADVERSTAEHIDATTGEVTEKANTSVTLKGPSWKVDALLEILEERPGQQVVVFAPSKQLINLAGVAVSEAGYRVGYITGGVTGPARTATVDAFQAGELDVVCATTGAGGVGLTLTAARTVVFLQRPWSIVDATQAEDRLHRIGAERHTSIEVIDVVARNTIDTRVRSVLRERAGQLADLVRDPRIVTELLGGTAEPTERKAS